MKKNLWNHTLSNLIRLCGIIKFLSILCPHRHTHPKWKDDLRNTTSERLVPLADGARLWIQALDVLQISLWVEHPLGLWWWSHKHGSGGLQVWGLALPWIWWRSMWSWAVHPGLKSNNDVILFSIWTICGILNHKNTMLHIINMYVLYNNEPRGFSFLIYTFYPVL